MSSQPIATTVVITVNGTPVHGVITHYNPYDITIEITRPFTGFTTGCHIPCFARNHRNYRGESGREKVIELLTGLYLDLVTVSSKKGHLLSEMKKNGGLLDTISKMQEEQTTLRQQKASLKKYFKHKVISQKSYQSQVKTLKDRDFALHMAMDTAKTDFIEKHLSRLCGFVGMKQLFDFLAK
ncbi:hypothetical protein [Endozoicomonas lisbonensis]|uniref:Uncharacterized protein n=1 Tax=Endozoicomonas lisbonensis TaxID=3120522 RepID=A0ABV2SND5_9GAMM